MKTPPTPDAPRHTGFTLVELLVVVVVVGLLASVAAVPALDDGAQGLSQGELFVRDAIQTARARALATRKPHGVAFHPATDRFIVVDMDGTPVTDPLTRRDYLVDFTRPDMPDGLSVQAADFGATQTAAIFDAQGDPVTGGTVTLACGTGTLVLTLDAATGFID